MKKAQQSNWFSSILALMFALLLFFNANAQNNSSPTASSSQVYDEVLENIPVQLEYDQEQYFVSGYEGAVSVHLSSANRIQLNLQSNEDTRTFQVVADLSKTPLGTTEVQLRVKGLSTAITAEIEPKTITVTKEKKVTKSFDVVAQLPDSIESEGYKVNKIEVNPKKVEIITGEETAKAIDQVVAPLSNVKQSAETIKQTVNVQALDSKGQILKIQDPAPQVKVVVDLSLPSKEVGLTVTPTGTPPTGIESYTYSLSDQKVEIRGSKSILEAIDAIDLTVDISGIRSTTKQTIKIPATADYLVDLKEVEVTIVPIFIRSSTNFSQNNGQGQSTTTSSPQAPVAVPNENIRESSSTSSSAVSTDTNDQKNEKSSSSVSN